QRRATRFRLSPICEMHSPAQSSPKSRVTSNRSEETDPESRPERVVDRSGVAGIMLTRRASPCLVKTRRGLGKPRRFGFAKSRATPEGWLPACAEARAGRRCSHRADNTYLDGHAVLISSTAP